MINIKTLQQKLNTEIIGKPHIQIHEQVTSTNDIAIEQAKTGAAKEGTLIIANHQTAGRGRYGRTWQAPPDKCILASVIFTYRLKHNQVHLPNLIGALSIAQSIHKIARLAAEIKYPNDVRIGKKKVAGVLTDIKYNQQRDPFFVLGFGVNVNIAESEFSTELRETATSLRVAASQDNSDICRTTILCEILSKLEENYLHLKSGKIDKIKNDIKLWEGAE